MTSEKAKKDLLLILESDKEYEENSVEVDALMREFAEELKPIGVACKNWAKAE
jgi:hypothetical protein